MIPDSYSWWKDLSFKYMYQHAYVPREKNGPGQQLSLGHFMRIAQKVPQGKLLTQSLIQHWKS